MNRLDSERFIKKMKIEEFISFLSSHNLKVIEGTERNIGTNIGNRRYIPYYKLNMSAAEMQTEYIQCLRNEIDANNKLIVELVMANDKAANADIVGATAGLYAKDWSEVEKERKRYKSNIENLKEEINYNMENEVEYSSYRWWEEEDAQNFNKFCKLVKHGKEVSNYVNHTL